MAVHIFDLDGVLVDAKHYHFQCLNWALEKAGITPISSKEHLERFEGLPTKRKLTILRMEERLTNEEEELVNIYKQEFTLSKLEYLPTPVYLFNPLVKLSLSNRLGIASNAKEETVNAFLKFLRFPEVFEVILGNDSDGVENSKPNPSIYTQCIKRMNVLPNEVTAYEDTDLGELAARSANILKVVRVNNTKHLAEVLEKCN